MAEHMFGVSLVVYGVIAVSTYLYRAFFKIESNKTTTGFAVFWPIMFATYLGICFLHAMDTLDR